MTALDRALIKVFTHQGGEPAPAASKAPVAPAVAKPAIAAIPDPYSDAANEIEHSSEPMVEQPTLASASLASTYSSLAIDVGSSGHLNYAQAFEPDAAIASMQNLLGSYHAEWPSVEDLYAPQARQMPQIMAEPVEPTLSIVAEPEEELAPEPIAEPPSQPIPWPTPLEMPPQPTSVAPPPASVTPPTPIIAEVAPKPEPAPTPAPKAKKAPAPRKGAKPAAPSEAPTPPAAKPVAEAAPAPAPVVTPPAPSLAPQPVVALAPPAPTAARPLSSFSTPAIVEPEFKPLLEVDHYTWPSICDSLETLLAGASEDFSTVAESLRERVASGEKVIALAGCGLNAGCTTVLLCLARRLAVKGVKTVVVDADFSRPELARRLGVAAQAGWDDVLRGDLPLEEVVISSSLDQLAVAPWKQKSASGKVVANRLRAATTFGILRDAYDLVLIDAGCISNEEHAADFMQSCEAAKLNGVYLVFDGREGAIEEASRMHDQLTAAGIPVYGAIENFAIMTNERRGLAVYNGN